MFENINTEKRCENDKKQVLDILKQGSNWLSFAVLSESSFFFCLTEVLTLFCHTQLFV